MKTSTKEVPMATKHTCQGDMRSNPGAKPELKYLPIEKLYVDSRYQRNTKSRASEKNLEHLKENFSWAYCGALIVCFVPAEKKFAVIEQPASFARLRLRGKTSTPHDAMPGREWSRLRKAGQEFRGNQYQAGADQQPCIVPRLRRGRGQNEPRPAREIL